MSRSTLDSDFECLMNSRGLNQCKIDVLLIGGGIQGLLLLDILVAKGYKVGLVTNASLGHGQSLHAHGLLESGYTIPKPDLRASVVDDWLPYLKKKKVDIYGDWYMLMSDEQLRVFRLAWENGGYPYEIVPPNSIPSVYRKGDLFATGQNVNAVKIKDYCFPKRQLIRSFANSHAGQIVIGDIRDYTFAVTSKATKIVTVEVQVHATNERIRFSPTYAVIAAGAGTPKLVNSIAARAEALGGDGAKMRAALNSVTFHNLHMLTLRGSINALPNLSAFVPPKRLKIVSHLNDHHDGVTGKNDQVSWYVTNEPLTLINLADAEDSAKSVVDPKHTEEGFNQLFLLVPTIREQAKKGKIKFFVYAGCKQGIDGRVNVQYCEPVAGLTNVALALPSLAGGAWITAKKAVDLIQKAVKPTGNIEKVPGSGHAVVGNVTEYSNDTKWLDWNQLVAAYPGIKS